MKPQPQVTESQPALPLDLPPAKPGPDPRRPDPRAKPTWEEWCAWDKYRRLLNDHRISHSAFRLWHWYHNCKDRNGEVAGFRAEAWYIARKFKWKPATVYAMNRLLARCGYLTWRVCKGYVNAFRALGGLLEAPSEDPQGQFPFILPVSGSGPSSYAPKGTPAMPREAPSYAPKGTPAMPREAPSYAPKGTPAMPLRAHSICDRSDPCDGGKCESSSSPKREHWKILNDLNRAREEIERVKQQQYPLLSQKQKRAIIRSLRANEKDLQAELGNIPHGSAAMSQGHAQDSLESDPQPSTSCPDLPGPMPGDPHYQEWKLRNIG